MLSGQGLRGPILQPDHYEDLGFEGRRESFHAATVCGAGKEVASVPAGDKLKAALYDIGQAVASRGTWR
jgi:hypothetical protein